MSEMHATRSACVLLRLLDLAPPLPSFVVVVVVVVDG